MKEDAWAVITQYADDRRLKELSGLTGIDYDRLRNLSAGRIQKLRSDEVAKLLSLHKRDIFTPVSAQSVYIPIVGNAAAGQGADNHDEYSMPVPSELTTGNTVGWLTEGTSMMPMLVPGDLVLAEPFKQFKYGCLMLFRNTDGDVIVKIPRFTSDGDQLTSLNPDFPPLKADVEILGLVTGLYHSQGSRLKILHDPDGLRAEM